MGLGAGHAVHVAGVLAEDATQLRDLEGHEGYAVIRYAHKFASQYAVPQMSEEASQLRRTHPGRSPLLSLFSHQAGGIKLN